MAERIPAGESGETGHRSAASSHNAGDGGVGAAGEVKAAALDAQLVEHGAESGNSGAAPKAKKATLDEQIQLMKEKRNELKTEKGKVAAALKLATRKRRRLKKRAAQLSVEDLFDVCRIKDLNPDSMASASNEPPAPQS